MILSMIRKNGRTGLNIRRESHWRMLSRRRAEGAALNRPPIVDFFAWGFPVILDVEDR